MENMVGDKPLRAIFKFSFSLFLASLIQQVYIVVDSIIVGKYIGTEALAAVGVAGPVLYFFISIILGMSIGFSILSANFKGAQREKDIEKLANAIVVILFLVGSLTLAIGNFSSEFIFQLVNAPEVLQRDTITYLSISFYGFPFLFVSIGIIGLLRGVGDARSPLIALCLACVLNIVLDLVFVLHLKWGLAGAAYATVISQLISFLVVLSVQKTFRFKASYLPTDKSAFAPLVEGARLGIPLAMQHILLSAGILVLVAIVSPYGYTVIAAITIVGRIEMLMSLFFTELASGLTTFVGQNITAGHVEKIKHVTRRVIRIAVAIALGLSAIVIIFSGPFMRLFTNDPLVITLGQDYIHVLMPFFVFLAGTVVFHGKLNGLGKVQVGLYCTALAFCITRIPLTYFFGLQWGEYGLWWAASAGWLVGLVYTLYVDKTTKIERQVSHSQKEITHGT